jgi:hypothetical protein
MVSQRIRLGLVGLILLFGGILCLFILRPGLRPGERVVDMLGTRAVAASLAQKPLAGSFPAAPESRSELADLLNSPSTDVHSDLSLVNAIFIAYRSAVKDLDPVGENRDITSVLLGRNKVGFAFIPADCPALNTKGELCDRWGTPYFFHQISGEKMEIRSAGPDRELWNGDDAVFTP